jgi:DNA-directed RNA polymerase subunit RPC12/RpoP
MSQPEAESDSESGVKPPADVYFCSECGKPFTNLGNKLRHYEEEHPDYYIKKEDKISEIKH